MLFKVLDSAIRKFETRNCSPTLPRRIGGVLNRLMQRGLTAAVIEEIQTQRLRDAVRYVYGRSPFYRRLFSGAGLRPEDIAGLSDLRKIPFTTSQDIRQWRDFLCVPEDKLSAVFTTSGTTGEPKRVYYTFREMQTLSNLFAVAVRAVHPGNLVALIALPLSHGLWIGSASVQRAVERAGGLSLPVGADDPGETVVWMKRFNPNVIFSSPSYMTALTREAESCGFRPAIDTIWLAGELVTEEHKRRFSEYWKAEIYDSFGSTEIGSAQTIALPGCRALHLNDLHLVTEIIAPETACRLKKENWYLQQSGGRGCR
ncbi:MAG TPA: AMP-binding protein [Selenomonadales bacterium]|nr:AMP-binding protein [Selenomonadales bacterium]